jgi:hypothetical protein
VYSKAFSVFYVGNGRLREGCGEVDLFFVIVSFVQFIKPHPPKDISSSVDSHFKEKFISPCLQNITAYSSRLIRKKEKEKYLWNTHKAARLEVPEGDRRANPY